MAESNNRVDLLNKEINRIVKLVAEGKETVLITPTTLEPKDRRLSANRAWKRLNKWLDKSYPTGETAEKKSAKKAAKKRKAVELAEPAAKPAAKLDPKKVAELEEAKKAKLEAAIAAAKPDPEKKAKLDAAITSAKRSSDGEVGAKELDAAITAGYSKFFILARAKEAMN